MVLLNANKQQSNRENVVLYYLRWIIQISVLSYIAYNKIGTYFHSFLYSADGVQSASSNSAYQQVNWLSENGSHRLFIPKVMNKRKITKEKRDVGVFVIGRTAGSFVTRALKKIDIRKFSKLSFYYSSDLKSISSDHESLIISTRNPVERFISAFLYSHPKNMAFIARKLRKSGKQPYGFIPKPSHRARYECFPSIEEFALALMNKSNMKTVQGPMKKLNCTEVSLNVIKGDEEYMGVNLLWNYKRYIKSIFPSNQSEIIIIRKEHLQKDWTTMLSLIYNFTVSPGSVKQFDFSTHEHDSSNLPLKNNLSIEGRNVLCNFLKDEILLYLNILIYASNLSEDDIDLSLEEIGTSCPTLFDL